MAFDPNAYLADSKQAGSSFDPIAYLSDKPKETYRPSRLQNIADSITTMLHKIDSFGKPKMEVNTMQPQGDKMFHRGGEAISEYLGKKEMPGGRRLGEVNPYVAAIPGTVFSLLNPQNWIAPKRTPTPLLQVTPEMREALAVAARESALSRISQEMGTMRDLPDVGAQSQSALKARDLAMREKKASMYSDVPGEIVTIPYKNLRDTADTIISENQDRFPGTRSGAIGIAETISKEAPVQNTGRFEVHGVKKTGPEYGVKYSASPGEVPIEKPNYGKLKALREHLNDQIESNRDQNGKLNSIGRDFSRLKQALDKDIQDFVSGQKTPLSSMVGEEFSASYKKANAFSRAYDRIFGSDEAASIRNANPEHVLGLVFKKNNSTAIKQFRALVGDDAFQSAKRRFTQDLLESKNISKEIAKYKPSTLQSIYPVKDIERLNRLGQAMDFVNSVEKANKPMPLINPIQGSYIAAAYALLRGNKLAAMKIIGLPEVSGATKRFAFGTATTVVRQGAEK